MDEDTSAPRLSLNFYTILLLGVINKRTEINENLVKIVVLNVEKGLKSTNREVKAANYMILAQLTSIVVPLKVEVTLRLISVLLKVYFLLRFFCMLNDMQCFRGIFEVNSFQTSRALSF